MTNLVLRILTAVILLPIVLYALISGGVVLLALVALVGLLVALEVSMFVGHGPLPKVVAIVLWLGLLLPMLGMAETAAIASMGGITVFTILVIMLFAPSVGQKEFFSHSSLFFISLYVFFGLASTYWLRQSPHIPAQECVAFILTACIFTWLNDTFAYLGGRTFGKHPLFLRISQKKTVEGFVIGSIFSIAAVLLLPKGSELLGLDYFSSLSLFDVIAIAIPGTLLSPLGDLTESKIKRVFNVKDSSNILPGHGGILDRIDSLLIMLPWTATYALIIRPMW